MARTHNRDPFGVWCPHVDLCFSVRISQPSAFSSVDLLNLHRCRNDRKTAFIYHLNDPDLQTVPTIRASRLLPDFAKSVNASLWTDRLAPYVGIGSEQVRVHRNVVG